MVSLHKHGGSRRQGKGWEVFKPRQEGMRRGRRVDGTDPGGRRSVRVLSTLSVVSTAVGTQEAAVRMLLRSSSFFWGGGIHRLDPSIILVHHLLSVQLFLESVLCRGRGCRPPFIIVNLLPVSAPSFIAALALNK